MRTIHLIAAALLSTALAAPAAMAQNTNNNGANCNANVGFCGNGSGAGNANAANNANQSNNNNGNNNQSANNQPAVKKIEFLNSMPGVWRANKLNGLPVFNGQNQQVGTVKNILVDQQGRVAAVVIAGGDLTNGHTVAVPFKAVQWETQNNNGGGTTGSSASNGNGQHAPTRAVLQGATKQVLQNAPRFKVNNGG